ncbi:MAG TPA: hypothetical protein VH762_09595 [Gemmatimonadaceae bacterium]|jgi:predicted esterase
MNRQFPPRQQSRREFVTALALSGVAGALGCSAHNGPNVSAGSALLHARPATPTRQAQLGRSDLGLAAGRDGILYVPQSYSPDKPAPLVILLHGAGGSAANWFGTYGTRADALGIVMLALDSRGPTWDAIRGEFGPDVAFIDSALQAMFERCAIDPRRIAIAGFSDGASYAISLGLPNGDFFTHVIAFSPGFVRDVGWHGKPPVFISHGTIDPVLPIGSTSRVIVPGLRARGYSVEFAEFVGSHEVPSPISAQALDWFLRT